LGSNPSRLRDFSLLQISRLALGAHPASYSMGMEGSFPGPKQQKCEVDHSSSENANFIAFTLLWTTAELAATLTVYNNFCSSNFLSGII
jgi:hypothetical protein